VKRCLGDGALACAEELAGAGKKADAVALYQAVANAAVPKYMQLGALDGQFRLQKAEAKDLLLTQIRSEDKANFNLACRSPAGCRGGRDSGLGGGAG